MRVFVPTYRRPTLLARALASLRAQTVKDWVCELHNDDPADSAPAQLVAGLDDPRIRLVTHPANLGALTTFDLFFRATAEPFYSLLEDDNWWEPRFLEEMLAALEHAPAATVAWCNQRRWRENHDGTWSDTGVLASPVDSGAPRLVAWGRPEQAMGALHANGAMLVRSQPGQAFSAMRVPFTGVELIRERQFPHPMLFVPQPLANFAITRRSARADEASDWFAFQAVALATFVRHAHFDHAPHATLWDHYSRKTPPATNVLLVAALICRECRPLLRLARPADWLRLLRSAIGHPVSIWRALRVRTRNPHWWETLDRHTATRFAEARRTAPAQHAVT